MVNHLQPFLAPLLEATAALHTIAMTVLLFTLGSIVGKHPTEN